MRSWSLKSKNNRMIFSRLWRLKKKNSQLAESLDAAQEKSVLKKLQDCQLRRDYEAAISTLERIPPEVLDWYTQGDHARKERPIEEVL